MNRREFLKVATGAVAAAALPLPESPLPPRQLLWITEAGLYAPIDQAKLLRLMSEIRFLPRGSSL